MLDLLLPERCAVCERLGAALCSGCRGALVRLHEPLCALCGSPGPWPVRRCAECAGRRIAFARARAAIVYDERARRLVREWKERGRRRLADDAAVLIAEVVPRPEAALAVAYVPGDPERTWERGDVGPRRLALALARRWDLPAVDLLRRPHAQRRQRELALADRRRNVTRVGRRDRRVTCSRVSRRRRLHVRGHRGCVRSGASQGRCDAGGGRDAGQGGSLDCRRGHRLP